MIPGIARFDIETDGSGDYTEILPERIQFAFLDAVEWVDGDLADGVDAVLSVAGTPSGVDQTLLTLTDADDDAWEYPRSETQDNTGANNGGLTRYLIVGKLKLVVSSGGASATGSMRVYYFR